MKLTIFSIFGLALFVLGSAQSSDYDNDDDDGGHGEEIQHVQTVVTDFERKTWNVAADLYKGVNQKQDGNFVMSPLSLTTVMVMLNRGAEGQTATEIQNLFKLETNSRVVIQNHTQVLESLNQTGNKESVVELVTASRIFANSKNANIVPSYETDVSSLGKVETFDFADSKQIVEKTNEWVKTQTHEKISKLVEEKDFTDETAAVLLNAVYFKAPWKHTFNSSKTKTDGFHVNESSNVQVDMMSIFAQFPYADLAEVEATAVFLPYSVRVYFQSLEF